jgi:16S rRNA processing protein RimM
VRGLLRVQSHAANPADLAAYGPLSDEKGRQYVLEWKGANIAAVAELRDGEAVPVADRNAAARLTNRRLYLDRDRLPPPEPDEFYLADLLGLAALDASGAIGRVIAVHDYGAGVSLEIVRGDAPPLLVPFTREAVPEVDLATGRIRVNPPNEIEAGPSEEAA